VYRRTVVFNSKKLNHIYTSIILNFDTAKLQNIFIVDVSIPYMRFKNQLKGLGSNQKYGHKTFTGVKSGIVEIL